MILDKFLDVLSRLPQPSFLQNITVHDVAEKVYTLSSVALDRVPSSVSQTANGFAQELISVSEAKSGSVSPNLNILFAIFLIGCGVGSFIAISFFGLVESLSFLKNIEWKERTTTLIRNLPIVRGKIEKKLSDAGSQIMDGLEKVEGFKYTTIPENGLEKTTIVKQLCKWADEERSKWEDGKASGCVYHGRDKADELAKEAYGLFSLTNPLHPGVFPAVRKMESEVISMTAKLFGGGDTTCGSMTSGGTESILLAVKAYRDRGKALKGIEKPNIVVPSSVHAAFDKGCQYFKVQLKKIPVDRSTMAADVYAMRRAIDRNTIAIVGSAPSFPHGIIDPIEQLATVALKRGIPLHVDACLGSFLIPFASEMNKDILRFDFRVDGVTSISVDPHKFGYCPKGSSVLLWRSKAYRKFQYSTAPDWNGGIYATSTIAGSRPGGLVAGSYAAILAVGKEGYRTAAKEIIDASKELEKGIGSIPELKVIGKPLLSVVAFTSASKTVNIFDVLDAMTKLGYELNALQNPAALHFCVTRVSSKTIKVLIQDLRNAVHAAQKGKSADESDGMGAMYGMAARIPKSFVSDISSMYLDALLDA
eukprot:Plantae.Rhodophyta-Hildenbrandia_rubra.ctg1722.p1 GENE.Plantae.Rhodophyta-Hildenbrandia_rubra.ctg1722~~Plantae.Rhodophyta-Hildenbrandia_rubra.ctg1722.p1  ORF type:complete len:591 (+),score=91.15 Plantae.Rhodophyta-Hildenbrandia_rubra.ctg1722:143-1915(+)